MKSEAIERYRNAVAEKTMAEERYRTAVWTFDKGLCRDHLLDCKRKVEEARKALYTYESK